ncbi:MAG: general secretion pathway protein GspK [Deltaproteobacteria bacterium]|nr:general secretion pathway protein GspK [Deltaproteobacteria bacterium]
MVTVTLTDESGKVNINRATEPMLFNLLTTLDYDDQTARAAVDAILDWRDRDSITRPFGAESDYYQGLNPPYAAKDGPLDTVEELGWIRGLNGPGFFRLKKLFTVQRTGRGVNINAAPLEVLRALGLTAEQAQAVIQARALAPIRNRRELMNLLGVTSLRGLNARVSFRSSRFFEIVSTGVVGYGAKRARHTVKAIVRINVNRPLPWDFVYWADDYAG